MTVDRSRQCAVAVMAKAPRPGHVKTRLQGVLRPEEASALGTAFLRDMVENLHLAARAAPIVPFVAYAPAGQEARFDGLLTDGTELLLADGGNGEAPEVEGFGRVLLGATRSLLAMGFGAACVLGADSPTLPTQELVDAARLMLSGAWDAVFGAVEDGGYYLLGLREAHAAPFARIRWSSEHAGGDTLRQLAAAELRTARLRPWFDVDDPQSLRRLLAEDDGYAAAHTMAALDDLRLRTRLRMPA